MCCLLALSIMGMYVRAAKDILEAWKYFITHRRLITKRGKVFAFTPLLDYLVPSSHTKVSYDFIRRYIYVWILA